MDASMKIDATDGVCGLSLVGRIPAPRRASRAFANAPDAVESLLVGNAWDHETFRRRVLEAAAEAGLTIETVTDLADAADVPRTSLSKWFRGKEQPGVANLRKLAPVIKMPLAELLVLAGRSGSDELAFEPRPAPRNIDPLADEIGQMLADSYPAPADIKERFRVALEVLVDGHRKWAARRRRA